MGAIDLDPASSEAANTLVMAKRFYTAEDDGLSKNWRGRVWMNPPYSSGLIEKFTAKIILHVVAGEVDQAVVLVNNATDTGWFQDLATHASALCLVRGRVRFLSPDGEKGAPLQGQAVLYLGTSRERFVSAFGSYGLIWNLITE